MSSLFSVECKVCHNRGDGFHFGVMACRACAAFWRRCIADQRTYFCKTNQYNCTVEGRVQLICKSCRFQKCKLVGMRKDEVQKKRDGIHLRKKLKYKLDDPSTATIEDSNGVTLETMKKNYRYLVNVRKTIEERLPNPHKQEVVSSGKMKGCRLASIKEMNWSFQCAVPNIEEFICSSFPEVEKLDSGEKNILTNQFLLIVWCLGNSYRTFKKVPADLYSTITLMTETFYLDIREIGIFLADSAENGKEDVAKIVQGRLASSKQKIVGAFNSMQIQEEEYLALLGLMLWMPRAEGTTTANIQDLGQKMRKQLLQQLYLYYTNKYTVDYALRLGDLVALQSIIMAELRNFREDIELFSLLDAFDKELYFYTIITKSLL